MHLFEQWQRRRLLMADGFTIFGGWIDFITILNLAVFKFHANAFDIAVLSAATLLPGIILSAPIGRLIARPEALLWLRWSLLLRALLTATLAFIPHYGLLLAVLVLRAGSNSLALPCITAITARNIAEQQRRHYYALLNMINATAKIAAPALGAALTLMASDAFITLLSAALTLFGWLCFLTLGDHRSASAGMVGTTDPGLNLCHRLWLGFAGLNLIHFCALYLLNNHLPVIISFYGLDRSALGLLVSASATGNFLCSLLIARSARGQVRPADFRPVLLAMTGNLALFMAMAVTLHLFASQLLLALLPLFFVQGAFSSLFAIATSLFLADNFTNTIGTAASRLQAIQNGAMLLAPFTGAALLHQFAPPILFLTAGSSGLLALLLFSLPLRLHRRQPTPVAEPDQQA